MKRGDEDERSFCNKVEAKQSSRLVPFIIRFTWKKLKVEMNGQALLSVPVALLWVLISPFICSFSSSLVLNNSCAYGKVFLCFYWVWKTGSALLGWSITPHAESPAIQLSVEWYSTACMQTWGACWQHILCTGLSPDIPFGGGKSISINCVQSRFRGMKVM